MDMEQSSSERAGQIRNAVKSRYRQVAKSPEGYFTYPVGVEGALKLGYDSSWIESVPEAVVRHFVGVGNPFSIRIPRQGDRVLDTGCGCGFDSLIAALLAGTSGRTVGIDVSTEMLQVARAASEGFKNGNVEFREGSIEQLPFEDDCFDLVLSNGVLNLVPDKQRAFNEIARVLRKGGAFAAADLLVMETIPPEVLASADAWST